VALDVSYPVCDPEALIAAGLEAMKGWQAVGADGRTGICLEILDRLNKQSFELAHAVMMTTGQGWMMAFQAGAPHAQDRGLEAVAYAWREQSFVPAEAVWEKPQGKNPGPGHEEALPDRRPRHRPGGGLRHFPPPGIPIRASSRRCPPATR
jgi:hypothetical protein